VRRTQFREAGCESRVELVIAKFDLGSPQAIPASMFIVAASTST
jgi:hypothetical protein